MKNPSQQITSKKRNLIRTTNLASVKKAASNTSTSSTASTAEVSATVAAKTNSTTLINCLNDNFILKRRVADALKLYPLQSFICDEMRRDRRVDGNTIIDNGKLYDFCQRRSTHTPSPTPIHRLPANLGNNNEGNHVGGPSKNSFANFSKSGNTSGGNGSGGGGVGGGHKVVIYFGDSLLHRGRNEATSTATTTISSSTATTTTTTNGDRIKTTTTSTTTTKPTTLATITASSGLNDSQSNDNISKQLLDAVDDNDDKYADEDVVNDDPLPSYIESIQNGVINIKIERNYRSANALVEKVARMTKATETTILAVTTTTPATRSATTNESLSSMLTSINNQPKSTNNDGNSNSNSNEIDDRGEIIAISPDEGTVIDSGDWSYVQQWRTRHTRYNYRNVSFHLFSPER